MVAASLWLYSGDSECRVVPVWQEACRPDAVRFWLLGCSNKHRTRRCVECECMTDDRHVSHQ
jgi:hypothetical protein